MRWRVLPWLLIAAAAMGGFWNFVLVSKSVQAAHGVSAAMPRARLERPRRLPPPLARQASRVARPRLASKTPPPRAPALMKPVPSSPDLRTPPPKAWRFPTLLKTVNDAEAEARFSSAAASFMPKRRQSDVVTRMQPEEVAALPPVIVGGTDGSGTRAAVVLLRMFGVTMVRDNDCTMDVHGGEIDGGWPPLVEAALNATGTADYAVSDVPQPQRDAIRSGLRKLMAALRRRAVARISRELYRVVGWGFKAPISQALLPFFAEIEPGFRFMHVIRDGRDIAFSSNQSPVRKFYSLLFPGRSEPPPSKAVRLWRDINTQVHQLMLGRLSRVRYVVVKIEATIARESLLQTAERMRVHLGLDEYVNQPRVCCRFETYFNAISTKQLLMRMFVGVRMRYGKWRREANLTVQTELTRIAKPALDLFGYTRDLADHPDNEPYGRIKQFYDDIPGLCANGGEGPEPPRHLCYYISPMQEDGKC